MSEPKDSVPAAAKEQPETENNYSPILSEALGAQPSPPQPPQSLYRAGAQVLCFLEEALDIYIEEQSSQ